MSIEGKNAIVTGSSKGIGYSVAEALVREGVNVVVTARNQKELQQAVDRLRLLGTARVAGKPCDVQEAGQVSELVEYCVGELGGLDYLINNAGIGIFKDVQDLTPDEWRRTIATNLDGLFYCCHFALPEMKKRGEGFIVNIGSLAGKNAFPAGAAYNASKFGLIGFSEALMQEVRHDDIRVAYIMPGSVETWFGGKTPASDSWKLQAEDVAAVVVETLKRHPRCLTSRIEMRPSKPPKK